LRKKKLTIKLSMGLVLGMMLALGIAPGTAHAVTTTCVKQGSDAACATESSNESDLLVCDNERDGNGVYAEFRGYWGAVATVTDSNGSADGCGTRHWDNNVLSIMLCEDDWGPDTCVTKDA
jgi:hypothetical protein